jgi:acetyl esterase/lipase
MKRRCIGLLCCLFLLCGPAIARAADGPEYTRKEDVIYGRKHGVALTMDVLTPKNNSNGAAVIFAVSGGWISSHDFISPNSINQLFGEFLKRGYTVFAVVHGSQPKYTIPEILEDMHRAVRFIRYHAKDYGIDPDRIGITGGSAGGHLSLMQGTAGKDGNPKAVDPVDRVSSRVQAVACLYPPTDIFNYGEKGKSALAPGGVVQTLLRAPFDFHELDQKTRTYERITDPKKIEEIARQICPITHVKADSAPTLILHGDKDTLVPLQQAEVMIAKLKEVGVPCELVVKKDGGHGWKDMDKDMPILADWFDKYLKKASK